MSHRIESVRRDFPALGQQLHGRPLSYLDSAATALKPQQVIDAVTRGYGHLAGNVHRSIHGLAGESTNAYEAARRKVAGWLNAERDEIIFTAGATAGINLVAQSWARPRLKPGDEVLVSGLEHHANWLPWQQVCGQTGARFTVVPLGVDGAFCIDALSERLSGDTAIVAVTHISNVTGAESPIAEIAECTQAVGAKLLVDGAQAAAHMPIDVLGLGADFYAFSGHKVYGPNGVGVLWGRRACLEEMEPWQTGGGMVQVVGQSENRFASVPHRFEAGTPPIVPAIGLAAAIEYLDSLSWEGIGHHERAVTDYAIEKLYGMDAVRIFGPAERRAGIFSFSVDGVHPHDLGTALDAVGVAVRAGHLCAQPLLHHFGVRGLTRASLGVYSCKADVDLLCSAIEEAIHFFRT